MPSIKQPKSLSHAVDESIVYRAGMLSVRSYIRRFCDLLKDPILAGQLLPCSPGLTGNGETDGLKLFGPSTSHTLAEKHGAH